MKKLLSLLCSPIMLFSSCDLGIKIESQLKALPSYEMPRHSCRNEEASYRFYISQFGSKQVFEVRINDGPSLRFSGYSMAHGGIDYMEVGGLIKKRYNFNELTNEARGELRNMFNYHLRNFHECKVNSELEEIREIYDLSVR